MYYKFAQILKDLQRNNIQKLQKHDYQFYVFLQNQLQIDYLGHY